MQKLKIFFLSLILIFAISTGVRAEFFSDVIVTSPNGIWTDSRSYTTLNDAVTAVGTVNQRTIVIASPQTVTALTVPSNITLKFERDGAIVNSGQLTINTKNIISDGHKIFAGLGDIDFASGTVVKLSWFHNLWNALTMTSDDRVTMVIDKAINATASVAVGNDVTLRWEAPNIITANAGVTVSNIGQIEAGSYQILAGAGNFRFRDGVSLNLEWFPYLRMALTWIDTTDATIVVNESSDVDYSDSVPLNIQLKINNGGALDIAPGVTLTLADTKQIDIGPCLFDPFTGTGSVTITGGTTYTPATTLTSSVLCTLAIDPIITNYDYEVDALISYGDGTDYTDTTLMAACTAVGVDIATILIRPGTWIQSANVDYIAVCPNAVFKFAPGAIISHGTNTLNIPNINAGLYQIFSGTGTVTVNTSTIYPDWWGGKGDDSTDSTSALLAALNNLSVGRKLVIGDGKWHFSSSLTWLGNSTEVECRGVLVYDGTDASTAITIGSSDEPRMMKGNIKLIDGNGTDWSVQKTGVETIDLLYADLRFDIGNIGDEIGGFYTGLKVTASTGNGNVYNNYRLGTIYDNKRGIVINSEGTGWVNENIFYQGSFSVKSAVHVGDLADTYYVYIPSSTNSPNNNRFIAPSFEGDDVYCWFYNNGPYQLLFYPRMEGSPTYKIYNDTGGIYSSIVLNYVSGIYSNPNNGISDASGSMYINDRVSQTVGLRRYYSTTAEPTVGTFRTGDILHKYNPSYGSWSHKTCISSGTYSSASDSTGDTDGSTAVITGMADTSDFYIGEYVTVSAGLPSATTAYKILAKTDSSITLNTNSNSVQSNVTVATVDPVWAVTSVAQADNTVQSITYASKIAPDLSLGHILQVAQLTGNIKIDNPTNTFAGQRFSVQLLADGTGRSITYGTYFKAATTSLTANKRIILDFLVIATNRIVQINTPIECD